MHTTRKHILISQNCRDRSFFNCQIFNPCPFSFFFYLCEEENQNGIHNFALENNTHLLYKKVTAQNHSFKKSHFYFFWTAKFEYLETEVEMLFFKIKSKLTLFVWEHDIPATRFRWGHNIAPIASNLLDVSEFGFGTHQFPGFNFRRRRGRHSQWRTKT